MNVFESLASNVDLLEMDVCASTILFMDLKSYGV